VRTCEVMKVRRSEGEQSLRLLHPPVALARLRRHPQHRPVRHESGDKLDKSRRMHESCPGRWPIRAQRLRHNPTSLL
jgi:hypothetical protein